MACTERNPARSALVLQRYRTPLQELFRHILLLLYALMGHYCTLPSGYSNRFWHSVFYIIPNGFSLVSYLSIYV
jgi:hypothetical protein